MKKLIYAALAATMALGAALPASAWGYQRCDAVKDFISNYTVAKECHAWIVDQGIIKSGHHKGAFWQDAYPQFNYKSLDSSDTQATKHIKTTHGIVTSNKVQFQVDGKNALKTKEMSDKEFEANFSKFNNAHKEQL